MPLHPQVQVMLDAMSQMDMPPIETLEPAAVRAMMNQPMSVGAPVARVEDRRIPGPVGDIPVRIYWPGEGSAKRLVVFFHGGGFVLCNLDSHDAQARLLALAADAVVISVDYRLAPEHPFPAAQEDCYAATCWALEHAAELGARPETLAVAGDSAGGCLAAAVCLMARDRGGPAIAYQMLIYPVTDAAMDTASYRDNAEGYFLSAGMMAWFWGHYLASPEDATAASPLRAGNFAGLPPASVITAEYDPLRDEGAAYAQALQQAGVEVSYRCWEGMIHGFSGMLGAIDAAEQSLRAIAEEYCRRV